MNKWKMFLSMMLFCGIIGLIFSCAPTMKDIPKLQTKLQSTNEKDRIKAVKKIGKMKDFDETVPPILYEPLSNDQSPKVRAQAAESLGNLKFADSAEVVRKAMGSDEDDSVRSASVVALHKIVGVDSQKDLIPLVESDPSPTVRVTTIEILGKINSAEAMAIIKKRAKEDKAAAVRIKAIHVLSSSGDKAIVSFLIEMARQDESEEVQKEAVLAAGKIPGQESVDYICSLLDGNNSVLLAAALEAIRTNKHLLHESPKINQAIENLVKKQPHLITDSAVIQILAGSTNPALTGLMGDYILNPETNSDTAKMMAKALGNAKNRSVTPRVMSALRSTSDFSRQVDLVRILSALDDPQAGSLLLSMFNSRKSYHSCLAAHLVCAIGNIRYASAHPTLCKVRCKPQNKEDKDLRYNLDTALSQIESANYGSKLFCTCEN